MLLPLLVGTVLVSVLSQRLRRFRWALWVGGTVSVAGGGFLLLLNYNTSIALWITVFAVFGLGNGMVLTGLNVTLGTLNPEHKAAALVMNGYIRTTGMTLGLVFGDAVFRAALRDGLARVGQPIAIADGAEAFSHEVAALEPTDQTRVDVLSAYVYGFQGLFWLVTAVAMLSLVVSFAIRNPSPRGKSRGLYRFKLAKERHQDTSGDDEKQDLSRKWEKLAETGRGMQSGQKQAAGRHVHFKVGQGSQSGSRSTTPPGRTLSPGMAFLVLPSGDRVPVDIQYGKETAQSLPRKPPSARLDGAQPMTPKEWV